jgi:hypothetical protein
MCRISYPAEKEIADSGQLSMARATSAASPGPGSGTRTCPRPSSVMAKIFGLTSEQRPWPWQRLASMDSGTCGPLSYHVRLHTFLHEHVDEATSSRTALSAWGQLTAGEASSFTRLQIAIPDERTHPARRSPWPPRTRCTRFMSRLVAAGTDNEVPASSPGGRPVWRAGHRAAQRPRRTIRHSTSRFPGAPIPAQRTAGRERTPRAGRARLRRAYATAARKVGPRSVPVMLVIIGLVAPAAR